MSEYVKVVDKKWGREEWLINEDYCGKRLVVNKGAQCSLHYHKIKDELFYIEKGKVTVEHEGKKVELSQGDFIRIKPTENHRFYGIEDSVIIEISTHHSESDSFRLEKSKGESK